MISESDVQKAFETVRTTPYLQLLGIELESIKEDEVVMSLEMRDELRQPYGLLHGGATASLIDATTALAVINRVGAEEAATTIDLTVQFLRPHTTGKIICTAKIVRAGKRIFFLSAEVVNEQRNLVATAVSTYTKV